MTAQDLTWAMALSGSLSEAPRWSVDAWQGAVEPSPLRVALVALGADGSRVGLVVALTAGPEAELEWIAVPSEHRRRGVARTLLRELCHRLRAAHATELLLEVRASNQRAIGFYQAEGFAQSGLRRNYYADPTEDAVLLRLELS